MPALGNATQKGSKGSYRGTTPAYPAMFSSQWAPRLCRTRTYDPLAPCFPGAPVLQLRVGSCHLCHGCPLGGPACGCGLTGVAVLLGLSLSAPADCVNPQLQGLQAGHVCSPLPWFRPLGRSRLRAAVLWCQPLSWRAASQGPCRDQLLLGFAPCLAAGHNSRTPNVKSSSSVS